jgi:hypothetical protein
MFFFVPFVIGNPHLPTTAHVKVVYVPNNTLGDEMGMVDRERPANIGR